MSSALPPSPDHIEYTPYFCDCSTGGPNAISSDLLCPHCHPETFDPTDMEFIPFPPPSPPPPPTIAAIDFVPIISPRRPAPDSAIFSLPEATITDPTMLCPICKDHFAENSVANMLPCTHAYHPECIIPWLKINTSCPVCRLRLPVDEKLENEPEIRVSDYDHDRLLFTMNMERHMERVMIQQQRQVEMIPNVGHSFPSNVLHLQGVDGASGREFNPDTSGLLLWDDPRMRWLLGEDSGDGRSIDYGDASHWNRRNSF